MRDDLHLPSNLFGYNVRKAVDNFVAKYLVDNFGLTGLIEDRLTALESEFAQRVQSNVTVLHSLTAGAIDSAIASVVDVIMNKIVVPMPFWELNVAVTINEIAANATVTDTRIAPYPVTVTEDQTSPVGGQ